MAPTSTLPDNPVYAFCPEYGSPDRPQQIRIVFENILGSRPADALRPRRLRPRRGVVGQIIPLTHRAFWSDYLLGETTDVVD